MAADPSWLHLLVTGAIAGVTSGGVISVICSFFLQKKTAQVQNQVRTEFDRQNAILLSQRKWKEAVLSELLGPVYMQLDRTKRAFGRYNSRNLYLEAKVLRVGNETIRDLLLTKGHLIPAPLVEDAGRLVEHYDRWLEEFDRQRADQNPELGSQFVFVGPQGFPFPSDADSRFRAECRRLAKELGADISPPVQTAACV
jgi:hypothetical protein